MSTPGGSVGCRVYRADVTLQDATEPRTPAVRPHRGQATVLRTCRAAGDIDMATAGAFYTDLHDTIDNSDEAFVSVDCSGATFMGPAGYRALVEATNYAARRGHTLVIRNLSPSCATLMRVYDLDRELRFEPAYEKRVHDA